MQDCLKSCWVILFLLHHIAFPLFLFLSHFVALHLTYWVWIVTGLFAKSSLFHPLRYLLSKKNKILSTICKEMNRYYYFFKDFINIGKKLLGNLNCIEKPESLQNTKILDNIYCKRQTTKQITDAIKAKIHKVQFIPQWLQQTLLNSVNYSSQIRDH